MNIMNEYIETKEKMPQRWKDQYMSTWGSVPPSCRDVYFNYLILVRWIQSSISLGPNIHPHGILEGLGNLPRRDIHIYICLFYWCIVSYCIFYCQKDPIEATLIIYDSLLRFQIRVRHDRLKCKQMFLEKKFLEFSPEIDWIIQITSSPGNLTFLWSSGSEPGKQTVQSNVVNRIWPGCLRWWSRGSQTWHWLEAAEDIKIRPRLTGIVIRWNQRQDPPCPRWVLPQPREGQSELSSGTPGICMQCYCVQTF